jgi:hypothetical protein
MQSEAIDAVGSNGTGLRIEFSWRTDRYGHTVSRIDDAGSIVPLLDSIEAGNQNDWPHSPPLQTLTFEELPDGRRVALLLGMAGRSHWSVSIEPLAGEAKVVVDVACRHATTPASLGSRYRRVSPAGRSCPVRESEIAAVSDRGEMIEVVPLTLVDQGTTRWRYVLSTQYRRVRCTSRAAPRFRLPPS